MKIRKNAPKIQPQDDEKEKLNAAWGDTPFLACLDELDTETTHHSKESSEINKPHWQLEKEV